MKICLLLPDTFNPNLPARPGIIEVYGNYLNRKHHFLWLMSCLHDCNSNGTIFENVDIIAIPDNKYAYFPFRIFYFFRHYFKKYKLLNKIFSEDKYDLIQVRNNLWDALLALYLKKKFKIPFVFQYTFPIDAYKFEKSPQLHVKISGRFTGFLLKIILKKCDFIFPISNWMKSYLVEEGTSLSKIMAVPMGANIHKFTPEINGDDIRRRYGLNDSSVILYLGSLDKLREVEIIIHAILKLNETSENIKLMLIGAGNDRQNLEKLTETLEIKDKVVFTGLIPYSKIPDFIAASDICLSSVPPIELYEISSPTKMFEYMSMEKPVVANKEIPEHKKVLNECNCGILVDFDSESFAKGIKYLLDNSMEAKIMGKNGRLWVVKNRSYENISLQIEEQYYRLIS